MKLVEKDGAVRFEVHAKPRAKKSRIVSAGSADEPVEIALAAQPVEGAANEELVRFVARLLGVPKRDVELVRGDTSRTKLLAVTGLSSVEVETRLHAAVIPSRTSQ